MKRFVVFVALVLASISFLVPRVESQSDLLCRIDITKDGIIDLSDYSLVAANFGSTNPSNQRIDITQDGIVDLSDFSLIAANFGKTAPFCTTSDPSTTPVPTSPSSSSNEWTQHAFNAQNTNYSPIDIPTPWKWKWSWNGPDANGKVPSDKTKLPRNVQPVTGGGRVYIAAGSRGIFALNSTNGSVVWNATQVGTVNSTVAYDTTTNAVFAVSTNGVLYKLNSANGTTLGTFNLNASSTLPLPPKISGDSLFIGMGNNVFSINKTTLAQQWIYNTGSAVHTPPAYSPSRNMVVVATQDLFVHGVNNTNGAKVWRVKHTPLSPGDPRNNSSFAEVQYGWPVIAESHGYVLVKLRLSWDTLWATYQTDNAAIRQFLEANPAHQALLVIDLDDGSKPFITNIGHGGYGDGGYMPMGFQPTVKQFSDGAEVAYVLARGETKYDPRWDTHLGELVLDETTAPGFLPGYFRYINYTGSSLGGDVFLTDEQPFVSAAGNYIFANHWDASMHSLRITDRSGSRGTYTNRIQSQTTPTLVESLNSSNCNNNSHYVSPPSIDSGRFYPAPQGAFHTYCQENNVFDRFWSNYATTVVSDGMILTVSTSGTLVALQAGNPTAENGTNLSNIASVFQKFTNALTHASSYFPQSWSPQVAADSQISHDQAASYSGSTKTIEGKVNYIFNNGKSVLLGFAFPHQGHFKIQIKKDIWGLFGHDFGRNMGRDAEPLISEGDTVSVTGKIEWYQGDPVIYLDSIKNLDILDAGK